MWPVVVVAGKDLRERLRDRSALILGVVAPLLVTALMSFAFASVESFRADVAFVDSDRSQLSATLRTALTAPELSGVLTVHDVPDESSARRLLDDGTIGAGIVVPPGFGAGATGTAPVGLRVLADPDEPVQAQVAQALSEAYVAQLNADRLSVHTALAAGVPPSRTPELAAAVASLRLPESVEAMATGDRPLTTASYYAPAMGIMFVLFSIGFTARSYFTEQSTGTLERVRAAPVRRSAILVGKSLAAFVYCAVSLGLLAVVSSLAFDARWGPPIPAAALILAMSSVLVALTALVVSVSRTERQADGLATILTFVLLLLGGNFVLVSQAPEVLRKLALLTPNGWALRGFTDLATGAGAGSVLTPVAVILAATLALSLAAVFIDRRRMS